MKHLPEDVRGAVTRFAIDLCKGMLHDDRWNWDVEAIDWQHYQSGFCDPTILRTTLSVFLNNLRVDDHGTVVDYEEARFRGFQYFRALVDPSFALELASPPFSPAELEEFD